ncbi:MAG: helix-turn-helix domain-containing protein [Symbiobacteriaceae bacterium]|nr:helix-turn-helix domain-containing protein [Symbiobacteriaceae bacterium]
MGVGETLRRKREELGYSIADVHKHTLVMSRHLINLENEDWASLPEDVLARGYLRSYARLLGLDASELWQMLLEQRQGFAVYLELEAEDSEVEQLPRAAEERPPDRDPEAMQSLFPRVTAFPFPPFIPREESREVETEPEPEPELTVAEAAPAPSIPFPATDVWKEGFVSAAAAVHPQPRAKPEPEGVTAGGTGIPSTSGAYWDVSAEKQMRERQRQQRLLQIQRQRFIISAVFWLVVGVVFLYLFFAFQGGAWWQAIWQWIQNLWRNSTS